jgi:hypothetical protein
MHARSALATSRYRSQVTIYCFNIVICVDWIVSGFIVSADRKSFTNVLASMLRRVQELHGRRNLQSMRDIMRSRIPASLSTSRYI